ncbi:MAG: hypothetical protein PHU82_00235 [Candidatus Pacebacteria bacterium]|jgi:hypothetical protein|nr:hypothetical protein [Candidatus Paceibacterota bacterium]MDD5535110.1 hypothetical protein [Candidatus Paceibacterota bacterium]
MIINKTLPGYFLKKVGFYALGFLKTYFVDGRYFIFGIYQNWFAKLEYKTGLIVNFRYFTIPLWQEHSIPAYLLSIPYRIMKIIIGIIILTILTLFFGIIYLLWFLLPFYLIFKTLLP